MKKSALCFSILLGLTPFLKAEQLLGINISYKNLYAQKYAITYTVFTDRYFQGIIDTTIFKPLKFKIIAGNASVINFPKLIKVYSLEIGCNANKKTNPIYYYVDTIDLSQSSYSSLISSGECRIYFTCTYPERYRNLKNLQASNYFTYAYINICNNSSNSSATTSNLPYRFACCNQPFYHNSGSSDTVNFDSIAYKLSPSFTDINSKISFLSGYSSDEQIDVYWPTGYDKSKGPNPRSFPPIGFFLDSSSGDLIFTPTLCNAVYAISIEATEYKKIGNRMGEVGGFLNDFVFNVNICPDNNPPLLNGPYNYIVQAGQQICFTITSDDKQFIPPPPQKPSPPDTVRLTWNRGIAGASFTIVDPKARLTRGKFCWTPKLSDESDIPYTFTITARDNACPLNGITVKPYSIKVEKPVNSTSDINQNMLTISPNPSSTGQISIYANNVKFNQIDIYDISGRQLQRWNFEETNLFFKNMSELAPGIYLIKCFSGSKAYNFKWIRE